MKKRTKQIIRKTIIGLYILILILIIYALSLHITNYYHAIFTDNEPVKEETEDKYDNSKSTDYVPDGYVKLTVDELLQKPELPTGCESVSLTALLKYYGFNDLDKSYIADNYLIYSDVDSRYGFTGDPHSTKAGGCFQNIIQQTANNFLSDRNSNLIALDMSGIDLNNIYALLDNETPLLMWTTISMKEPSIDQSDNYMGDYTFYRYEHCVMVYGYNLQDNVFYVMDPIDGLVERNIDDFYDIFCKIGKYAMIIQPKNTYLHFLY